MSSSPGSHLRPYDDQVRILVVDDEAKMAQLLRRGLVEHGSVVEVATTGEEAIASRCGWGLRRDPARRDASRHGGVRSLSAAAGGKGVDAGADADSAFGGS